MAPKNLKIPKLFKGVKSEIMCIFDAENVAMKGLILKNFGAKNFEITG